MPRVKRGPAGRNKRKKLLERAEGFFGSSKKVVKVARKYTLRADRYAYRDRKVNKREFRSLWISRLNACLRTMDYSYSRFMKDLKTNNVQLDRKILDYLVSEEPATFEKVVQFVKA